MIAVILYNVGLPVAFLIALVVWARYLNRKSNEAAPIASFTNWFIPEIEDVAATEHALPDLRERGVA